MCQKYEFKSENYDLKHHKRILDLSLMFRFSGLPNNAQLEMVEATKKRSDQDIMIMLQLENGTRLQGTFKSSDYVQIIINSLCPEKSNDIDLVIVYMRTEVYGNALGTTTLKSLGLTGGRAIMRLINRNPELLKT